MNGNSDHALLALDALKPVAKLVPVAGSYLEGIADLLKLACMHAKDMKANKHDTIVLTERAIRYVAIIAEMSQKMTEADISSRMSTICDFRNLMEELVWRTSRQAERSFVSRAVRKDKDKEDIANLSKRLDQVIVRFGMETQLNTIYGVEDILSRVKQLQIGQEQAKEVYTKAERNALLDRLHPIATARHDHERAPRGCTEGTRVAIIERIMRWVMDSTTLQNIFWLSGLAGTGKTAIMKTLSERLAQLGVLGGCFFVSMSSAGRRDPLNIVHTLAYQLARFQSVLCEPICNVLRNNPDIVSQAMSSQIPALLLDPFAQVLDQIGKPIVILIDAMDECDKTNDVEGGSFLPVLLSVIRQHPAKLKLVLTSRLSPSIRRIFNSIAAEHFQLQEIEKEAVDADIQRYLETEFEQITQSRGLEHSPCWYTFEDLAKLIGQAGGLFIYAFTVVRWVSNTRFMPKDRLHQILQRRQHVKSKSPFQVIDDLYGSILQSALGPDHNDHGEVNQRIHELLKVLVVAFEPLPISDLAWILEREEDVVRLDLEQLSALVPIPERGSVEPVIIYHASFIDFLTDEKRRLLESGFYVSVWEAHGWTGARCLKLDYKHRYGKRESISLGCGSISQHTFVYASKSWQSHLKLSPNSGSFMSLAIKKVREIASQRQDDAGALSDLSSLLHIQSMRISESNVILEKIAVDRQLLKLTGFSHPSRGLALNYLAVGLCLLYERQGDEQLLHEAIALYQQSLELRPPGHPSRDLALNDLANGLRLLYSCNGDEQLIREAVILFREALELRPPGHPSRDWSLNNLATGVRSLYLHDGDVQLLHEAIALNREALELRPPGHPVRDWTLNNLANGLRLLYECKGNEQLLHEAIGLHTEALELRPVGHPSREWSSNNLAGALWLLSSRDKDEQLLHEAIGLYREALELRPSGHPYRDWTLNNLANALSSLYSRDGDEQLLNEAICLYREALELRTTSHPFRYESLNNLAIRLRSLYSRNGDERLLHEAIRLEQEATELRRPVQPS